MDCLSSYDFHLLDEVHNILQAANKHPNSKVAKLIHTVREDPSQRNIVLLLIALAEHSEYSVDFNISLKYVSVAMNERVIPSYYQSVDLAIIIIRNCVCSSVYS